MANDAERTHAIKQLRNVPYADLESWVKQNNQPTRRWKLMVPVVHTKSFQATGAPGWVDQYPGVHISFAAAQWPKATNDAPMQAGHHYVHVTAGANHYYFHVEGGNWLAGGGAFGGGAPPAGTQAAQIWADFYTNGFTGGRTMAHQEVGDYMDYEYHEAIDRFNYGKYTMGHDDSSREYAIEEHTVPYVDAPTFYEHGMVKGIDGSDAVNVPLMMMAASIMILVIAILCCVMIAATCFGFGYWFGGKESKAKKERERLEKVYRPVGAQSDV